VARNEALRTAYLNGLGYRVLRVWNAQVNTEIENVLDAIYAALTDL
jgi:very-short-patch-repair endonuclease